jgi:phospholipase/carboxylesterase
MYVSFISQCFKMKLILLACFLVMQCTLFSDTLAKLHYIIREPKVKTVDAPLLILLHGVGSNERDLFSFADQLPDKFRVIALRSPVKLAENSYGFYRIDFSNGKMSFDPDEELKGRKLLIDFVSAAKKKFGTKSKVILVGFSQGAIMSYNVLLTQPELLTGIAAMSGRIMEGLKPNVSKKKLEAVKVFISHGTEDQVLGIQYGRTALTYFKSIGITPEYHEYPVGHTISSQNLSDLITWLNEVGN